jgi:hypothetical protein
VLNRYIIIPTVLVPVVRGSVSLLLSWVQNSFEIRISVSTCVIQALICFLLACFSVILYCYVT